MVSNYSQNNRNFNCHCSAASCLSWVPEQGSVGASGDLAPLAHLALGIVGEGKMWSAKTGWGEAKRVFQITIQISRALILIVLTFT